MSTPLLRNHFLQELLTSGGTAKPENWLWDELLSFLSILDLGRQNLYLYTYWSVGAFRHGDYIAKLRVRPTEATAAAVVHREVNTVQDDEPFRDTLVAESRDLALTRYGSSPRRSPSWSRGRCVRLAAPPNMSTPSSTT